MVWACCNIADIPPEELQRIQAQLSPSRKEHILRFQQRDDQVRSLAGEVLAQRLLAAHFGNPPALLHRHPSGKPYLTGCDLQVSISHCNQMAACAISREPVGIDIEQIRPIKPKLCHRVCVPEERDYVLGNLSPAADQPCHDPEVMARFFEVWTAKEAYFKKIGTGITDLKSVNILHLPRQWEILDGYMVQIL